MKKVISSQRLEPVNLKKLPLYQQIEFFNHWLCEINQTQTPVPEEILSIKDLEAFQQQVEDCPNNKLDALTKTLSNIFVTFCNEQNK